MLIVNEENNVFLTRGDHAIFDVEITDENGDPYTMISGDKIIFTLRKLYDRGVELIKKESSVPTFEIVNEDTKDLDFGVYVYDVCLYNSLSGKYDTFIPERLFEIGKEAHDFNE